MTHSTGSWQAAADTFRAEAGRRLLVKDGAYGTMIQAEKLVEADYRGDLAFTLDQRGNNDLLNLTRPDIIAAICKRFVDAGADLLATNTFNATSISQSDYGPEAVALSDEINRASARLIRSVTDAATAVDGKPRWVAGAMGPTNKTLSLSPRVDDPGFREVDFDGVKAAYRAQVNALVDGGVDFILIETVFDTLNAKAAIMAAIEAGTALGAPLPIMVSMTLTDLSGRNLSGHTVEAFWASVRHARPLTIGLNCSFGAAQLRPHLAALSKQAETLIMAYPNAGLPNDLGDYDEAAEETARQVAEWVADGLVNVVGGCCGTTPAHIAAIAQEIAGKPPRMRASDPTATMLAGLEHMILAA